MCYASADIIIATMPDRPAHGALDYTRIEDGVYIGTNGCCRTHLEEMLVKEGVTADISLEKEHLDMPFGAEEFIWIPTEDHTPPSMKACEVGIAALDALLANGQKVYIHCKNGHGRAPTFFAAYLIRRRGMTPDAAVAAILGKRTSAHLEENQKDFLKKLAKNG